MTTYNVFKINTKNIINLIKTNVVYSNLSVFIVNGKTGISQGGTIGRDKYPVIFITTAAKKNTICHEFIHAVVGLGDEYGGIDFIPTEKEVDKYKNLTINKNKEWELIKKSLKDDKIGYYQGGMGTNKGVYHSYPECLMRNLGEPLCPICIYYTIHKLNQLTGKNIDFFEYMITVENAE